MYSVEINKKTYNVEFAGQSGNKGKINNNDFELDLIETKENSYHVLFNNKSYNISVAEINNDTKELTVIVNNIKHKISVKNELDNLLNKLGLNNVKNSKIKDLKAPMPGLVVEIPVNEGEEIKKGENLIVLEAMKMENNLKASDDVKIKKILVVNGKSVEKNDVLIIFE